ncbi:YlbD family protein [Bacillus sp. FJAT-49736]|uniref:YlbD family protein n=1 Tax=Bacillus sp. FJAT-49736 TaxID=2833582 RepID=UPI001BCA5C75|nr:YlbD family protein [Bacillus sp. FJAT-49736]MBS4172395.1 YlbD family protein [Bacillus sp. FJAT-49736]
MATKKLHPSVEKFKSFVKEHPGLIKEVRKGEQTWQDLFEDWYLLGEDDPRWESYQNENAEGTQAKEAKSKSSSKSEKGWMNQIGTVLQKMDPDQMQHHINNLSQAIAAVQGVLAQFQSPSSNQVQNPASPEAKNPFSFRKD